jgi:hypothetical protein
MRKSYFFIIFFFSFTNITVSQITYTWVGGATGDYQVASNWLNGALPRTNPAATDILSFDAISNIEVTNVPNQTIGAIKIASGTGSVSFSTNLSTNVLSLSAAIPLVYTTAGSILSADYLTINIASGTAFNMTSGIFGIAPSTGGKIFINRALSLNGGTLNFDVPGTGGTTIYNTITYISGNFTSATASAISWNFPASYIHNVSGLSASAIPVSTWTGGTFCVIQGMNGGNIAPAGLDVNSFFNFTWNCTAQSGDVSLNMSTSLMTVNGTMLISSTNSKSLIFGSGIGTINIYAANYTQSGANTKVVLQSSTGSTTLSVTGTFSHTLGTIDGVGGTGTGTATLDLKGAVTKSATWQSSSSSPASKMFIQFSGVSQQTVNISGTWSDPANGTSNIAVSNKAGINLASGTLKVVNTASTSPALCSVGGPILGIGSINYTGAGAGGFTLIYNNDVFQTATATEFPSTNGPTNLTINNSLGVSLPLDRTIPGTLSMVNGNLAIGAVNVLQLTNATLGNQISYTAGYITTGTLSRLFPTTGLPTSAGAASRFPFGTGINDRSLNVFFSGTGNLTGGTAGMISVTHTPNVNVTAISPVLNDNGISLDKRTNTSWTVSTGLFSLGSGADRISITAQGTNIGSVTSLATIGGLRLTDGSTSFGTLITTTGTDVAPIVGKSNLMVADINSKSLYFGSDNTNLLLIISFTWNGSSDKNWANAANWTPSAGTGYPSSPTENAIIDAGPSNMPEITSIPISIYQLSVGAGASIAMIGTASINVTDAILYNGTANFSSTSTFIYSSQSSTQNIAALTYGKLTLSGIGPKKLPNGTIKVTGTAISQKGPYEVTGAAPTEITSGTNTFIYDGTAAQQIFPTFYNNLTINNDRGGQEITLGNLVNSSVNTIKILGDFAVNATNYVVVNWYNFVDFISTSTTVPQKIPGFNYAYIYNTGNGLRVLDPLGSTDPAHVITTILFSRSTVGTTIITGSKVKWLRTSALTLTAQINPPTNYNDLEISGNFYGAPLTLKSNGAGMFNISGKFTITATNFVDGKGDGTFNFNGNGDQIIPANYPDFSFNNINITGSNTRKIIFEPSATKSVGIMGAINVTPAFVAPYGFETTGSTINFSVGSYIIPVLPPANGSTHYNNISITGGTRSIAGDMTIGGNLTVSGSDASMSTLKVGDNANPRIVNVLGNISVTGTTSSSLITSQIDMYPGTGGSTKINLYGNLSISGAGQLMGTTGAANNNGTLVFAGTTPQTYTNTATVSNNGLVNFTVGDGILPSYLILGSSMNLLGSTNPSNRSILTVANKSSLNSGIYNIVRNGSDFAIFKLNANTNFITTNTGGVEGPAVSSSTGSIINDGSIVKTYDSLASYTFNASASTNMGFPAASTPFPMYNLTIGDGVNPAAMFTLNKSIDVSNVLTFKNNASFDLAGSNLALKSTASNTAMVAQVPANVNINYSGAGRFFIERYFPSRRSWRLITSPLSSNGTTSSIFTQWQNGGIYVPGQGTFITGIGAPANGFDLSTNNSYSLKTFQNNAYVNIANTNSVSISGTSINAANIGYFMFVRGDRDPLNFILPNSNITILNNKGKLQTGTQIFPTYTRPSADGIRYFSLIGNPYASPVDFNLLSRVNLLKRFIVCDPSIGTGAFVTFDDIGNNGNYVSSLPASYLGSLNQNIQSGQAFFVETDATVGPSSITFNESNKSTVNSISMFRPSSPTAVKSSFRSILYLVNTDNSTKLADGNLAEFDNIFNNAVDLQDAMKFSNVNENFSLLRNNASIAMERRQPITNNDTLFFNLLRTTQRNYRFEFQPVDFDPSLIAFIEDSYLGTRTMVNLFDITTYDFSISKDVKSAAANRFRIVFSTVPLEVLPVIFKTIKAYQQASGIAVEWSVENEIDITKYEVERSTDGVNFFKINSVPALTKNSNAKSYRFLDIDVSKGNIFYRIVSYNVNGKIEYSVIVNVNITNSIRGISIYPNPASGGKFGISFNNMEKGIYQLKLINSLGQVIISHQLNYTGGTITEIFSQKSKLNTGIYHVKIIEPDRNLSTIKLIVQ